MRPNIIGSILATVLVLAGLGFGGYLAYQAGYQNGLAETAAEVVVQRPFYPGFGLFFGFIFLLFLFGFISRVFFWGRWRGGHHGTRSWDHVEGSPMEKRLEQWHEQAHEPGRRYRSEEADST